MLSQNSTSYTCIPLNDFGADRGCIGFGALAGDDDAFGFKVPGYVTDGTLEDGYVEFAEVFGVIVGPDSEFAFGVTGGYVASGWGEFCGCDFFSVWE